ncbi:hypothetical protein [Sporomusa termitida]|uniref:hypothetical protein n=1 Tax=Sporomusa termitida TaxID=2377 RepID=UPI001478B8EF|nr:hypothetical protein [Sporomusa termitida]
MKIKEQGYNACLSVLRLSKTHTNTRLETACELALPQFRSPRYRHLKAILDVAQYHTTLLYSLQSDQTRVEAFSTFCEENL